MDTHEGGLRARLARRGGNGIARVVVLLCGLCVAGMAGAVEIRLNTGSSGKGLALGDPDPSVTWNYTGDFADPRYVAYVNNDPFFPPSSNAIQACHLRDGTCRQGNNTNYGPDALADGVQPYQGVQFFYLDFDLPSNAVNVSLEVVLVGADDRVGLGLNGNDVDFWGNNTVGGPGRIDGSDRYGAGFGIEPTRTNVFLRPGFNDPGIPFTLIDPALFNVGGENFVRLWVNNTNSRSNTAIARPMSFGDPSIVAFDSFLRFDLASVPEPATAALALLGLLAVGRASRPRG